VLFLLSSLNQPLLLIAKIRFDHNLRSAVFICDTSLTDLAAPRRQVPAQPLRIEHRWKQTALLFCRSTYRAGPRPVFVALLSVDPNCKLYHIQFEVRSDSFPTCFVASPSRHLHCKHSPSSVRIVPCLSSFNRLRTNPSSLPSSGLVRFKPPQTKQSVRTEQLLPLKVRLWDHI
jgi:hypothetical protein